MPSYTPEVTDDDVTYVPSSQCTVVSSAARLCTSDIIAIIAVAFFVWYIVWGIPMTIRAFRRFQVKLAARKQRRRLETRVHLKDDLEMGIEKPVNKPVGQIYADPYMASTKRLRTFLYLSDKVAIPEHTYNPRPGEAEDTWRERDRLDAFKFPPDPVREDSPNAILQMRQCPSAASLVGLYSPSSTTHASQDEEPSTPISGSFPSPPGLPISTELRPLDLGALEHVDQIPSSPPPVYLYQHRKPHPNSSCKPCAW
ncbi:hypothetical protein FKP32DRAFT_1680910 [Trametes sanguinea]|nr:hypothetical protein FKP32DRAFT_1680910 [Trametes sanguinea]